MSKKELANRIIYLEDKIGFLNEFITKLETNSNAEGRYPCSLSFKGYNDTITITNTKCSSKTMLKMFADNIVSLKAECVEAQEELNSYIISKTIS